MLRASGSHSPNLRPRSPNLRPPSPLSTLSMCSGDSFDDLNALVDSILPPDSTTSDHPTPLTVRAANPRLGEWTRTGNQGTPRSGSDVSDSRSVRAVKEAAIWCVLPRWSFVVHLSVIASYSMSCVLQRIGVPHGRSVAPWQVQFRQA